MNKNSCWACNAELNPAQKFCPNCRSWQNYRRHINLTSVSLSIAATAISLVSIFFGNVTAVYDHFFPRFSVAATGHLEKHVENEQRSYSVTLIAKNESKDDIAFPTTLDCSIRFPGENASYNPHQAVISNLKSIKPGHSETIEYTAPDNFNYTWSDDKRNHLQCESEYATISFGVRRISIEATVTPIEKIIPVSFKVERPTED